ncbi:MAG: lysylphosphatidylglycerol synthase transmembrane domain-containing protein [Rickettsiales bacterium]|nr:lysylphosphatidylglycerol synthase transmembrane domain-containing protein [Rickettsiales bacterium]
MTPKKKKKLYINLLKLFLSSLLIYFVVTKLDFNKLEKLLSNIDFAYIAIALISILIAQIFGGYRMRYYYQVAGMNFNAFYAVCFYFIGTMFNVVLPGGIGGDGYKAYYFQKKFRFPWQQSILATIRGRASGLFFLILFLLVFAYFYQGHINFPYIREIIILGLLLIFPAYSYSAKILLKESLKVQLGATRFSFIVQLFYLVAILAILESFGGESVTSLLGYVVVFLIANIVAIIPISIGGLGIREFTYITFAGIMNLDKDTGVAASFLFYIAYSTIALIGFLPYLFIEKLDNFQLKFFDYRKANNILEKEEEEKDEN